jgi:hypothetical protein
VDILIRLAAIEDIKLLRARWCRFLDERRWQEIETLLCADAILDLSGATPGAPTVQGAAEIREFVKQRYGADAMLLHLNFLPEIEIHSENHATAIWRQEVFLKSRFIPDVRHGHGYGTVHDEYAKDAGIWKIKTIRLFMNIIL